MRKGRPSVATVYITEYDDEEEKYEKKSNGAQTEEGQQGVHVQQIAEQE